MRFGSFARHPLAFVVASGGAHLLGFGVVSALGIELPAIAGELPAHVVWIEPETQPPREPEPEIVVEPVVEPARSEPPPVRVRRTIARVSAPEPTAEAQATEAEPAPPSVAAIETTTGGGLAIHAPATSQGTATGPISAGAPERSEGVADARRALRDWIARVRRTILARAARDYPRAAIRAHTEGTVTVAFAVASDGRIASISVARPSESELLDRAAVRAVEAVERLPPPPEVFRAHGRPLTLPITYRLD